MSPRRDLLLELFAVLGGLFITVLKYCLTMGFAG